MSRWLALGIAAAAPAVLLAACGGANDARTSPTATAPPAAVPTPQAGQPFWTVSEPSSDEPTQVTVEDGLGNAYTVASADLEVAYWMYSAVAFQTDLNRDGLVEAVVLLRQAGAHCCYEFWIFSTGPGGIRLDDSFYLGNAHIQKIEDLDSDGVPELETTDDRFAYFNGLAFFNSPFPPLVLCRSPDGSYRDCTPEFPERLERSAQEFEQRLIDAVQGNAWHEYKYGPALGLVVSHARLGRADEGWNEALSICPECEEWLTSSRDELEDCLAIGQPRPVAGMPVGPGKAPPLQLAPRRRPAGDGPAPAARGRPVL